MQQHYTHQRRSVAHIYTAAALYTHQRRSVAHIYTAVTLQTPTPQRSTYIHSNIITQPQYTQVHSHFTLIPTSALHVYIYIYFFLKFFFNFFIILRSDVTQTYTAIVFVKPHYT